MVAGDIDSAEDFTLREVTPDDGQTLKRLYENNPDGGDVQFAQNFKTDPYEAYEKLVPAEHYTAFIAETPAGKPAGTGFILLSDARVGGELRQRGYLAGVVVDHDYRGMGLGKRIAAERIQYAEDVAGEDVVIAAAIQSGNDASTAVAQSWAEAFPYEYALHPVEVLETAPDTEYEFQSIDEAKLPEFITRMNDFYSEAEMYSPYQTEQLSDLINTTVAGKSPHRCEVAVENGEFVAGAHIVDMYKLMSTVVEELPPELEDADELPPSIPDDLEIRPRGVLPWFKDGYKDAAEALIDYERANAESANRVMVMFDPDGPLVRLDNLSLDEGSVHLNWAIRGLDKPVEGTFIAPEFG